MRANVILITDVSIVISNVEPPLDIANNVVVLIIVL